MPLPLLCDYVYEMERWNKYGTWEKYLLSESSWGEWKWKKLTGKITAKRQSITAEELGDNISGCGFPCELLWNGSNSWPLYQFYEENLEKMTAALLWNQCVLSKPKFDVIGHYRVAVFVDHLLISPDNRLWLTQLISCKVSSHLKCLFKTPSCLLYLMEKSPKVNLMATCSHQMKKWQRQQTALQILELSRSQNYSIIFLWKTHQYHLKS